MLDTSSKHPATLCISQDACCSNLTIAASFFLFMHSPIKYSGKLFPLPFLSAGAEKSLSGNKRALNMPIFCFGLSTFPTSMSAIKMAQLIHGSTYPEGKSPLTSFGMLSTISSNPNDLTSFKANAGFGPSKVASSSVPILSLLTFVSSASFTWLVDAASIISWCSSKLRREANRIALMTLSGSSRNVCKAGRGVLIKWFLRS
mmetsp:Transcript_14663/g.28374  ORF Transcript_14663/g.28374 Transcript_14663/m.28374 type:complete len:202 (-) Transcript_14663:524-1129(-)